MSMKSVVGKVGAVAVLAFAAIAANGQSASAATATTNFTVTANVTATCSVAVTAMAFGAYDGNANATGSSTVTAACTNATPTTVQISNGLNFSTDRRMVGVGGGAGPADFLAYQLFTDAARTAALLPAGTAMTGAPVTIYGTIPGGQSQPVGNYSDSLVATLNY